VIDYHEATSYSPHSIGGHHLEWAHQPNPFKYYRRLVPEPLPQPRMPTAGVWEVLLGKAPGQSEELSGSILAGVLLLAGGVTAKVPGYHLRAAASAGALYPCELYLATAGVEGMDDGLWHFAPELPGLHRLRQGPVALAIAERAGAEPRQASFVISTIFWRSVWKYRARGWRYCLLDSGHVLGNLELALDAWGIQRQRVLGFADRPMAAVLGLATQDEAVMAVELAGQRPVDPGDPQVEVAVKELEPEPVAPRVGRDAVVLAAHGRSELTLPAPPPPWPAPALSSGAIRLKRHKPPGGPSLAETIATRRSQRNFVSRPVKLEELELVLEAGLKGAQAFRTSVVMGPCQGLSPGVYDYLPEYHALIPRSAAAEARFAVAEAALGQAWIAQAVMVVVMWAEIEKLQRLGGPRAYRYAMIEAGVAGQRLYLAATALGWGCCGVGAFYDEVLAKAVGLRPGAWPLYMLALGPIKRKIR